MAGLGPRLLFLSVAMAAQAGQTPQELFDKVRLNVTRNLDRMPKYTCVQRQERRVFEDFGRWGWKSCDALAEERGKHGREGLRLTSKQRFRLEVAVANTAEVFSWPGGEAFETEEVKKAVQQGISGMGDFGAFLGGIFANQGVKVKYLGEHLHAGRTLAEFSYRIPVESSHYTYKYPKGSAVIGYQGTIWADPATALLHEVTVEATDLPPESRTCRVITEMKYQKMHLGDADFLLPEVSVLTLRELSGAEGENETRYTSCRQYLGESTVRFDDPAETAAQQNMEPPPELPAGLTVKIVLTTPIHPANAAAGDAVDGVLKEALRDKAGKTLASANTVLHGRIMHFDERFWPERIYVLSVKFDRIERGGTSQPIWLMHPYVRGPMPLTSLATPRSARQTISVPNVSRAAVTFMVDSARLRQGRLMGEWKTVEGPSEPAQP
jgi:hypothetical protein